MSGGKNIIETFRDVAQDLLVPELKAVKVSVDSLRIEMKLTTEAIREEMRLSNAAIREEMKLNAQLVREEMKFRHEALSQEIRSLNTRFDDTSGIRERLAVLEALQPRQ